MAHRCAGASEDSTAARGAARTHVVRSHGYAYGQVVAGAGTVPTPFALRARDQGAAASTAFTMRLSETGYAVPKACAK